MLAIVDFATNLRYLIKWIITVACLFVINESYRIE